ncbi:MAG: glycosyltransferase [Parvularculaceae bacterium]|nr:glycosyltransferase [Parvularculaceae bacterium]
MKFSIITPVLNGAAFLDAAIASVRNQTRRDFEIIVVDGGSSDGSPDIVRRHMAEEPAIRLIEAPGLSQYASIARGFEAATGEIFAWLNADDLYTPWAFETVARRFARARDVQWVSGLPGCWDGKDNLQFIRAEAWRPRALIRAGWCHMDLLGFIQQESVFFRRALYDGLSEKDRSAFAGADLAGDFILWKRFARRARLDVIPTSLGGFRRHGDNRSSRRIEAYMEEARRDGAVYLPWPLTGLARRVFQMASASRAMALARIEDELTRPPAPTG